MNKEWSEKNKRIHSLLKKNTFQEGIKELTDLRRILWNEVNSWKLEIKHEDFSKQPFIHSEGYHSKTIAYSIWHIARIEDIVVNTLIQSKEEILFEGGWKERIHSPIITTGNELREEEISDFSKRLDINALFQYFEAVKNETDLWLNSLKYEDLKTRFSDADQQRIINKNVVSSDSSAEWLIDYWCHKDIKGLIQMPFSRHWIMHIEAAIRIKNKLMQPANQS